MRKPDSQTTPRRKRWDALVSRRVTETLEREVTVPPLAVSTVERDQVRSKLQLDRSAGTISLKDIRPDPDQPRRVNADSESFKELLASVRDSGVLQPITVRYIADGDYFQIIAGERRYQAACAAGLKEIRAIVHDEDDTQKAIHQLVENLHREDLNPIEEAAAYRRYMDVTHENQDQLAKRIRKSKTYVSRILAIDNGLTPGEKTTLAKVATSQLPGKSLIFAALQASSSETRSALLFGRLDGKNITVATARATVAETKRHAGGRPKAFTENVKLDELGATVTVRFPKKIRVAPEAVLEALDAARAVLKRKPPR